MAIYRFLLVNLLSILLSKGLLAAGLDIMERHFLAQDMASGKSSTPLILATQDEKHEEAVKYLRAVGGIIRYNDAELGYVRALVPVDEVMNISSHAAVLSASLPRQRYFLHTDQSDSEKKKTHNTSVRKPLNITELLKAGSGAKLNFSLDDAGIADLRKNNPTYDGRGVTIALIEDFFNPEMLELQQALTLEGRPTPKVIGIDSVFSVDPTESEAEFIENPADKPRFGYTRLSEPTAVNDKYIVSHGFKIALGRLGRYRAGVIEPYALIADAKKSAHSKQATDERPEKGFPIVHDIERGCYLIDLNRNSSVSDEKCIAPFNRKREIIKYSNPKINRSTSIVIAETDDKNSILVAPINSHTEAVALAAAGDQFFGTDMSGAAPAAKLYSVIISYYRRQSIIEGIILAARHPDVDIISLSLDDNKHHFTDNDVLSIIADRVVNRLNKLIFVAAGNSMIGYRDIGSLSSSPGTITVGQFVPSHVNTLCAGSPQPDSAGGGSSGGPTDDGRAKPDIIAPSFFIIPTSDQRYSGECAGLVLPPNSSIAAGTSTAAPFAAGSAAVLWSAARQVGMNVSAKDIKNALLLSARPKSIFPMYRQGGGLINIQAAWNYLRSAHDAPVPTFSVKAPLVSSLDGELAAPHSGPGLFERIGWSPGDKGTRFIKITRLSGALDASTYHIRIVGDPDGTFKVKEQAVLPLNLEVNLQVGVEAKREGILSAVLEIVEVSEKRVVHRVPMTVVSALKLEDKNNYKITLKTTGEARRPVVVPFIVPRNTSAIYVSMAPYDQDTAPILIGPVGTPGRNLDHYLEIGDREDFLNYTFGPSERIMWGATGSQSVYMPASGVWFLTMVDGNRLRGEVEYDINISAIVDDSSSEKLGLVTGLQNAERIISRARLRPIARVLEGELKRGTFNVGDEERPYFIELSIPPEALQVDAVVKVQDGRGQAFHLLNAMLLECGKSRCYARQVQAGINGVGIAYERPQSGKWFLAVDMARQNGQSVTLEYETFITHRQLRDPQAGTLLNGRDMNGVYADGNYSLIGADFVAEGLCRLISIEARDLRFNEYLYVKDKNGHVGHGLAKSAAIPIYRKPVNERACG